MTGSLCFSAPSLPTAASLLRLPAPWSWVMAGILLTLHTPAFCFYRNKTCTTVLQPPSPCSEPVCSTAPHLYSCTVHSFSPMLSLFLHVPFSTTMQRVLIVCMLLCFSITRTPFLLQELLEPGTCDPVTCDPWRTGPSAPVDQPASSLFLFFPTRALQ